MSLINRPGGFLVTRGMGGPPTHLIVRGFLPYLEEVAEIVRGAKVFGRRRAQEIKDLFDEIQISIALISINGKDLIKPIINTVRSSYSNEENINIEVSPKKLIVNKPPILVEAEIRSKNVLKD